VLPEFVELDEVESTMTEAAARLTVGTIPPWTVVLANHQTRGSGRQGRPWITAPGDAMLATIVAPLRVPSERAGLLAIAVGTAIADALVEWGVSVALKWPNDVYLEQRKLGGVLIHAQLGVKAIALIGIGINLRSTPPAVAGTAICLADAFSTPPSPRVLAEAIVRHCQATVAALEAGSWQLIIDSWTRRALWLNQRIAVRSDREFVGRFTGIDGFGRLILETDEGILAIATGDLEHGPRLST
jgi:BirA family transcriptional regulator, biotin operon repressor / biotin---[acetyl-CoA-carboxylase] ligase